VHLKLDDAEGHIERLLEQVARRVPGGQDLDTLEQVHTIHCTA
jgi:hypothetical protein